MTPRTTQTSGLDETVIADAPPPSSVAGMYMGRVLAGKYRLERLLGSGGMGEVYAGTHLALGSPIAVKTMRPHVAATPELARRFGREAHAASRLQHPNVVHVLDYGEDEGVHYIVMELLQGTSVGDWLAKKREPPPLAEIPDILVPALDALVAAHADGIVHRDLKPENIFLAQIAGKRVVKLLDFGLAHVDDPRDEGPTLTKTDTMGGTPEYMSPEQCRSLAVGPSADLYSIGCVLTSLLQLRPPFGGASAMDIISQHMFLPPPPLSRPAGAPPVPPLLDRLRLDLLAKSPSKRPRDAAEVKARLIEAMSPEGAILRLPTRKGPEAVGVRSQRVPRWDGPDQGQRAFTPDPKGDVSDAVIGLLRVGGADGGVGQGCVTGLAAQSLYLIEASDMDELIDLAPAAAILDAGPAITDACDRLRALAEASPRSRALVCAERPSIDSINALIAAGAADVVTYPVSSDTLGRKLIRLIRRGR